MTANKYPKKLYVGNPDTIGMSDSDEGKFYIAHKYPERIVEKNDYEVVAVYEFKGVVTVKNETKIIE